MLTQLREHQSELDHLGVHVIGVGTREAYQAQKLTEDGIGVELLLDTDDDVRKAVDADGRFEWWRVLHPKGAVSYARAARQARRFDPVWSEATQRPGLLLLDSDLKLIWHRMGTRLGDYPTVDEVIEAVDAALAT